MCSNGALLVSVATEHTVESVTFDPRPVLEELIEHVPDAVFAVEDVSGMFRTTRMFETGPLALSVREVPFEHLLDEPIVRIVVRSEEHAGTGFGPVIEKLGYESVIYGIGDVAWMDVGPRGVNKATMLQRLCEIRGYDPAGTIAIGDSWNDTAMLRWAGLGVAMDTAPDYGQGGRGHRHERCPRRRRGGRPRRPRPLATPPMPRHSWRVSGTADPPRLTMHRAIGSRCRRRRPP